MNEADATYTQSIKPVGGTLYMGSRKEATGYMESLAVTHHRWRNNNDIVTKVPLGIMDMNIMVIYTISQVILK